MYFWSTQFVKFFLTTCQVKTQYPFQSSHICLYRRKRIGKFVFKLPHCNFGVEEDKEPNNYWFFMFNTCLAHFYLKNLVFQLIQVLQKPVVNKPIRLKTFQIFCGRMSTTVHYLITISFASQLFPINFTVSATTINPQF